MLYKYFDLEIKEIKENKNNQLDQEQTFSEIGYRGKDDIIIDGDENKKN